jgi:RNA-binding protein
MTTRRWYTLRPFQLEPTLEMSSLTEKQKHHLRGLGHKLKPVVMIGNAGYTPAIRNELELSLNRHELLKVRVSSSDREARDALIEQLCTETAAQLVQRVGNIALLYRRNQEKPRLVLP